MADTYITPDNLKRFKDRLLAGGGTGSARIIQLTIPADQLADGPVTQAVEGLGNVQLASPAPTDDDIATWWESSPTIRDHGDDETIPDGSIRVSCIAPTGDLNIRFTVIS